MTMTTSVYEAIGGRAAVAATVDNFYGRLLADPELALFFPGGVGARHRAYVVTILGEALGGPERYRGPAVTSAHRGLGIRDTHFDRAAAHLAVSLGELGVPRHLADHIVATVAGLRPAVVTA
jgi:hemoglobin